MGLKYARNLQPGDKVAFNPSRAAAHDGIIVSVEPFVVLIERHNIRVTYRREDDGRAVEVHYGPNSTVRVYP